MFDEQSRLDKLSDKGNPLKMLSSVINFELFRELLEDTILTKDKRNNAGAKPYDVVMLFKILILQRYFGLSDEQVEYQIIARATGIMGLMNLTYNLFRYEQIVRLGLLEVKS